MPKAMQTILEIDLNALSNNYYYIKSQLKPSTKIMAVVKAFGYGSDAAIIAKELEQLGVAYFAVAYAQEGAQLRDAGIETPILVLHPQAVNFDTIINRCLEPSLYSQNTLNSFISFAETLDQKNYPVHLKFNTGLNRLGFTVNEISEILTKLQKTTAIKVSSLFSHLAASEDNNEIAFTQKQIACFREISEKISNALPNKPFLHTLNTSGLFNYPEAQYDMVRSGIGLYGFANDIKHTQHLQPVSTLKTIISQIHTLEKGDTLGYNRAFTAPHTMKTATLPLGHADGIARAYGNGKGWVTINGEKAFIIGNVCMDMIMVDVSKINCEEGDEVLVFGKTTTAENLAASIDSIAYEITTAVSQRIKRVVCRK